MELKGAAYLVLKAERAKTHLDALNRELDLFLKEPYTITRKDDLQNGRHIRRQQMKPGNTILVMLLGEFLYSLRCGLDQMAWQFSLADARKRWARSICFPIYDDLATGDARRNYAKVIKCFPDPIAREIDALQPFKTPGSAQEHPLWQLNQLCNLDKHCIGPFHSRTMSVIVPHNPAVLVQQFESEQAIEVSVPLKDKHQLDLEPETTCKIEFGDWEANWSVSRQRLTDIHNFITSKVIPKFIEFKLSALPTTRLRMGDSKMVRSRRY